MVKGASDHSMNGLLRETEECWLKEHKKEGTGKL